jgi:hypothetical protein
MVSSPLAYEGVDRYSVNDSNGFLNEFQRGADNVAEVDSRFDVFASKSDCDLGASVALRRRNGAMSPHDDFTSEAMP